MAGWEASWTVFGSGRAVRALSATARVSELTLRAGSAIGSVVQTPELQRKKKKEESTPWRSLEEVQGGRSCAWEARACCPLEAAGPKSRKHRFNSHWGLLCIPLVRFEAAGGPRVPSTALGLSARNLYGWVGTVPGTGSTWRWWPGPWLSLWARCRGGKGSGDSAEHQAGWACWRGVV